jgi:hypothetical protein
MRDSRSCLDRAVGACLSVLAGAIAIYVAVRLIQSVLAALLIIVGISTFIGAAIAILRARNRGW